MLFTLHNKANMHKKGTPNKAEYLLIIWKNL